MKVYGWLLGIVLMLVLAVLAVRILLPPPPVETQIALDAAEAPVVLPTIPRRPAAPPSAPAAVAGRPGGQDAPDASLPPILGMRPSRRPGGEGRGGERPEGEGRRGGGWMRGVERGFADIDPAVREELQELRRNNPDAFRERVMGMMAERRDRREQEEEALRDLAETLRATGRYDVREELRGRLSEQYDQRLRRDRLRLEQLREEQERLREEIGQREREKDTVLDQYLDSLSPRP